jgi:hypothetical protein
MTSRAHMLAQPGRDRTDDQTAGKRQPAAPDSLGTVVGSGPQDWRATRIREWLLQLLRFAITRDPKDQAAVFATADEIDALGLEWRPSAPSFFRRTSRDVCTAITTPDDPRTRGILERHLARIDDMRLKRAFQAAVVPEPQPGATTPRAGGRRRPWRHGSSEIP